MVQPVHPQYIESHDIVDLFDAIITAVLHNSLKINDLSPALVKDYKTYIKDCFNKNMISKREVKILNAFIKNA